MPRYQAGGKSVGGGVEVRTEFRLYAALPDIVFFGQVTKLTVPYQFFMSNWCAVLCYQGFRLILVKHSQ